MSKIKDMKIQTRLLLSFGVVIVLIITTGLFNYYGSTKIKNSTLHMLSTEARLAEYTARARANINALRRYEKDVFINIDSADSVKKYTAEWEDEFRSGIEKIELSMKIVTGEKGLAFEKLMNELRKYDTGFKSILQRIETGEITTTSAANKAIGQYKDEIHTAEKMAKDLAAEYTEKMQKVSVTVEEESSRMAIVQISIIAAVITLSFIISFLISRSITGPIKLGLEFSQNLARGDLTRKIDLDQKDEMGQLATALNNACGSVHDLIGKVIIAAQNLAEAVQEISSGNENLSQRTSEQASSLEEVASTIEEHTATINQNAENALKAREMTEQGVNKSESGNKVALDAVTAINEMNQSSNRINEIIKAINDIAFQTNLLALNAAVEAARAGEQGRGFAVVAGEVRNLAQRAGNAAKEIEGLIRDTLHRVTVSTDLVNKTGKALGEIADAARKTASLIAEISMASEEQKTGIGQINTAISELDSMTQQNASLVEETASASEEMSNQARELLEMVSVFTLKSESRSAVQLIQHEKE